MDPRKSFLAGWKDGIPICAGYLPVAFAFGVFSKGKGLRALQIILISLTNVTSAGQIAGVEIICACGSLLELALTQFVINLRYTVMSLSLSQRFDESMRLRDRFLFAFVTTDEVFAVAYSHEGKLSRQYLFGLIVMPFLGWGFGTALGAFVTDLFSPAAISALGIALYAMFISAFVPVAKKNRKDCLCILLAIGISCLFRYVPFLQSVPSGFTVILSAVPAAALFAVLDVAKKRRAAK